MSGLSKLDLIVIITYLGGITAFGLYVSRRVAEAQGGRAWGELTDGRLTFSVELPIAGRDSLTP